MRARARFALRLAGGGLLFATGAIHLDLYLTGYRSIPTIGWLFLLQVIAAFGLGVVVLATGELARRGGRRRVRPGHPGRLPPVLVDRPVRVQGGPDDGGDRRGGDRGGCLRGPGGALAGLAAAPGSRGRSGAQAAPGGAVGRGPGGLRAGVPGTRVVAASVAAVSVAALAVLGASVAVANGPAATAAGGSLKSMHIGGVTVLTNAQGTHAVLVRPGYRHQVGLLRDVRRILAAGAGSRDRWPGRHGQAGHDHPVRRVGPGHLRRASPVHLCWRHCRGPGQRQQAQPERRAVVRGNPVRLAAENSKAGNGPSHHAPDRRATAIMHLDRAAAALPHADTRAPPGLIGRVRYEVLFEQPHAQGDADDRIPLVGVGWPPRGSPATMNTTRPAQVKAAPPHVTGRIDW